MTLACHNKAKASSTFFVSTLVKEDIATEYKLGFNLTNCKACSILCSEKSPFYFKNYMIVIFVLKIQSKTYPD